MAYGDIVLASTKKGFIPNAIKWATKSAFSHSIVTMPDILGVPMCMEAAESGVDMLRFDVGYENNLDQGYQVWVLKMPQDIKDRAIQKILNELEIGYGFFELPWFVWRRVCAWFGKDIRAQKNWSQAGIICSELCVSYLRACGLGRIFAGYGEGSVSAQDLQDVMRANPDLFEMTQEVRLP